MSLLNAHAGLPGTENGLHEPFLRRAADADAEASSSHALGAFLAMRLVDQFAAERQPPHAAALAYQLRATRDFLTGLHPPTVEGNHLLQIVRVAEGIGTSGKIRMLWPPLLAFAYWLEQELRFVEAMDVLQTGRRLSGDDLGEEDIAAQLQLGRVLRHSGQYDESEREYARAGELAERRGDTHSALLSRIGRALVKQQLGNLPECERTLTAVIEDARRSGDADAEARACHDLGVTYHQMGRVANAVQLAFKAFKLYEQRSQQTRALNDTGQFLKDLGHYAAAKQALLLTLEYDPPPELKARLMVELMDLGAMLQDQLLFERCRREVQRDFERLPIDERVEFEIKMGYGLAVFDRVAEGEACLERALELAEQYGLGERVFRTETLLREMREGRDLVAPVAAAPPEAEFAPEVRTTIESLEALAQSH